MDSRKKLIATIILLLVAITIIETQENTFIVEETGKIEVYFCPENKCEHIIIRAINASDKVRCAFYDLTENNIISMLKEKKSEILIDEANYENYGKKIKGSGLMHNKFCILDDKIITGSFNPTQNNTNNNNIIIIESQTLLSNYKAEFEEIKNDRNKNTKTKTTQIRYNNQTLKQYFCPDDNCQKHILDELSHANKSIYFLTFTFTDKEIAQVLLQKHNQGLNVKGIMEKFQNHAISPFSTLNSSGINVKMDKNPKMQHNKIFIIDNKTVITGSYNPTKAANTINDENILILQQTDIVKKYADYFQKIYLET